MDLNPFIRWLGNKKRHLKHILPHVPDSYNTYIEPFIGGGSLFLRLKPKKWIINDINTELIDCWKMIKTEPNLLISY